MKSAPDNSRLDAFLKETLLASNTDLSPFDWSELEVLLRHEQKSIPVEINRKTVIYSAAGVLALLLVFGIFKIIQHYSSLPSEPEAMQDSTQNSFNTVDTASTTLPSTVSHTDTLKIDSSAVVKNQSQIDSSGVDKSNKKPDSDLVAAPLMPDSAWIRRIREKQDKKKKQAALKDSSPVKTDIIQPIIHVDTTLFNPAPAIKIKQAAPPIDTITKSGVPKNNPKKKKEKTKKATPPGTEQPQSVPPIIQSDSLKQQ